MNSLDDPAIKIKYRKCKYRVKRWESDFMDKYGRRPSKNDIRSADINIKEAYKMYWTLKTQALEETLYDITLTDDAETNVSINLSYDKLLSSNNDNIVDNSINTSPPKNIENIVPIISPMKNNSNEKSPVTVDNVNVDGVWGEHLNKDNIAPKQKKGLPISKSSSFQLSQNKFTVSTFSKRNPRKSLSMSRLKSKSSINNTINDDQSLNNIESNEIVDNISSCFIGQSMKVTHQHKKIAGQPLNPIQQLINGDTILTERNINIGWLDRCSKDSSNSELMAQSQKRLSGRSDSGVESIDFNDQTPSETSPINIDKSVDISDEDDFVCNSDVEEESKSKRIRNWRKSLSDVTSQPAKRLCIENISQITSDPLYNHTINEMTTVSDNRNSSYMPEAKEYVHDKIMELTTNDKMKSVVSKIDCKNIDNTKQSSGIKRSKGKSNVDNSDDDMEKSRVGRVTRSNLMTKNKNTSDVRQIKKQTAVKRMTRHSRKSISTEDGDFISKTNQSPEIPIYNVESLEVVPRFAVSTVIKGDLINELSQSTLVNESSTVISKTETKSKGTMTAKEKLEAKVAAGKINENFVRINLKKKVFVRGKRSFNFSRYKKNQWKQKKKGLESSEGSLDLADLAEKNVCFKCGDGNHIGKNCPALKSDKLLPLDEIESSDYQTLEEAENMANQNTTLPSAFENDRPHKSIDYNLEIENEGTESFDVYDFNEEFEVAKKSSSTVGYKVPQDLIDKLLPPLNGKIDPLYRAAGDGSVIETPKEVFETLKMFGHKSFRPGQEKAIMRILTGQSTLVTLSTGSGKSLCYQLPAYLYAKRSHCITLVISPLVSLMDDQVTGIPGFISAAALHTGQTPKVRDKIIETMKEGKLDILLISPEAVVAGEKSSGFGSLLRQLPPIAFVCIDEAHCISQWSHHFRPSYLMICRVLMEKMGVKTILGLTATATISTAESIVNHLQIHDGINGIICDTPLPNNLILTVSKDGQRDDALINLLKCKRFEQCDSIIIYCTRREECTRIAGLIRVSMQNNIASSLKSNAKVSPIVEAYHAGLAASRRKTIQKSFMTGNTRIVVATVAFGMGINKSNIRSVIHYNIPSSFERYVQEVGRAGRDNLPAHCHLFLNPSENNDKCELRRHIYANGVDRHIIRRLLQKIFIPCSCKASERKCPGHEVAIPIDDTVRILDITEETISTLLCYLELHPKKFITVLSSVYTNAKVSSYGGPMALKAAAQLSPPLALAIALDKKNENKSVIEFPVVDIAAALGWDSGVVKSHLKNLEWNISDGKYKRTSISVRYDTLGLRVRSPGDLTDGELDEALDALSERSRSQETSALQQLSAIYSSLNKYSHSFVRDCIELNDDSIKKSDELKKTIRQYFQSASIQSVIDIPIEINNKINEDQIISDIRCLICNYRDCNFTGRAIARIFHGIQSPNYSAITWSRCRFWRAHLQSDFNWLVQIATREILSLR